jgi:hypothetical protein
MYMIDRAFLKPVATQQARWRAAHSIPVCIRLLVAKLEQVAAIFIDNAIKWLYR